MREHEARAAALLQRGELAYKRRYARRLSRTRLASAVFWAVCILGMLHATT